MLLRQPGGALEATIGLYARSLQRARQLGGHQRFGSTLPLDPVERGRIFDVLFESLESSGAGVVLGAKPTRVSDFVPDPEIVEGQVLAIVLNDLFDNPRAVEDRDWYTVLLRQLVFKLGSRLISGKLAC